MTCGSGFGPTAVPKGALGRRKSGVYSFRDFKISDFKIQLAKVPEPVEGPIQFRISRFQISDFKISRFKDSTSN